MNSSNRAHQIQPLSKTKRISNLPITARLLTSVLNHIQYGQLKIRWIDNQDFLFKGKKAGPKAEMLIKEATMLRNLITAGAMGFAESYLDGLWDTPNLSLLLENIARNMKVFRSILQMPAPLLPLQRLIHHLRLNSLQGRFCHTCS